MGEVEPSQDEVVRALNDSEQGQGDVFLPKVKDIRIKDPGIENPLDGKKCVPYLHQCSVPPMPWPTLCPLYPFSH